MKRQLFSSLIGALTLALVSVGSASAAGTNLLTNPGFEDAGGSYNGWFTFGAGTQLSLPAGDNIIRTGAAASKMYGQFTGCPGVGSFSVGGFGQALSPTVGDVYTLSGYGYMSSGDPIPGASTCNGNRLIAQVAFFNAASGGAVIARNDIVIADYSTAQDQWLPFSVSIPAPTGALRVEALVLFLQPGCDTGAAYVDDMNFCAETPTGLANVLVNPSFDVDLTGWSTFGNIFHDARVFARRTPSGAAKMFSTFTLGSDSGMYQSFVTFPGAVWRLSAYTMTTCEEDPIDEVNDNFILAKIVFRDGGGTEVGFTNQKVFLDNSRSPGNWAQQSLTAVAPAGAVTVEPLILFVSPTIMGGAAFVDDVSFKTIDPTAVPSGGTLGATLSQSMPNPFRSSTQISFDLEETGPVSLQVYDVTGRLVTSLVSGTLDSGSHIARWDGTTTNGSQAPSGIYRYVLKTAKGQTSRSMVLTN